MPTWIGRCQPMESVMTLSLMLPISSNDKTAFWSQGEIGGCATAMGKRGAPKSSPPSAKVQKCHLSPWAHKMKLCAEYLGWNLRPYFFLSMTTLGFPPLHKYVNNGGVSYFSCAQDLRPNEQPASSTVGGRSIEASHLWTNEWLACRSTWGNSPGPKWHHHAGPKVGLFWERGTV